MGVSPHRVALLNDPKLLGWWRNGLLQNGAANWQNSIQRNAADITLDSGTTFVSGAMKCTSTSAGASATSLSTFDITGNWTVAQWLYWDALPSSGKFCYTLARVAVSPAYSGYALYYNGSDNEMKANVVSAGTAIETSPGSGFTPTVGTWHHFAASGDGVNLNLWVDGYLRNAKATAVLPGTNNAAITMGKHVSDPATYGYGQVRMRECMIYSRALNVFEIQELYKGFKPY